MYKDFSRKFFLSFFSDVVVIAALTAIFASVGLFLGKSRLYSLILAFYPAGLLFKYQPFNIQENLSYGLAIFLIIFLLISHVLNSYISTEFSYSSVKKSIEVTILGLSASSLAILSSYHVVSITSLITLEAVLTRSSQSNTSFGGLSALL